MDSVLDYLKSEIDGREMGIVMWDSNSVYNKGDVVLYFMDSDEPFNHQYVFLLMSMKDGNITVPNHGDLVNGIPDFSETDWKLLNPTSYLLQNLTELTKIVVQAFTDILDDHVKDDHGLVGDAEDIANNLVRVDYSNLQSPWRTGKMALVGETKDIGTNCNIRKSTSGVMWQSMSYGFDSNANQRLEILDRQYYRMKSPIWDESDKTIFAQKYIENQTLFSVLINGSSDGGSNLQFNNLRYGTNIFSKKIEFDEPFANDEYMVFFDTYEPGQFVFGYDKTDLENKIEPTYDAIVSMPMLMNKTASGFTVVLPIHVYYNSLKKYNIGVPWKNNFRFQAVGRYR